MMTAGARPGWLLPLSILLVLWALIGCAACFAQVVLGIVPGAAPEDLALVRSIPLWFNIVYGIATFGGLAAAVALVLRSRLAKPLFEIALIAVIVQFGYVFLATDTWARQGIGGTIFPLFIIAVTAGEVLLARTARNRGWIG